MTNSDVEAIMNYHYKYDEMIHKAINTYVSNILGKET